MAVGRRRAFFLAEETGLEIEPKSPKQNTEDARLRFDEIRSLIDRKESLRGFYLEVYQKFRACLDRCPPGGLVLELGSGAGFLRDLIPEVLTSDVVAYPGLSMSVDAARLPFENSSLRAIFMFNVFHHLPDVEAFLREAERCLLPGGRIFMVDQHLGPISYPILRFLHHEPMDRRAVNWSFRSHDPLLGANGALAWIVFRRDLRKFESLFPKLRLLRYEPHTPLRYWWMGGLKSWSLLPSWMCAWARRVDQGLSRIWPESGSFVDIEIVRN